RRGHRVHGARLPAGERAVAAPRPGGGAGRVLDLRRGARGGAVRRLLRGSVRVNVFARLCLVLGGLFIADAVIFWSLQHEHVGTSLIAMTAVGFAFIGLYAATSLRRARRDARREEEPP